MIQLVHSILFSFCMPHFRMPDNCEEEEIFRDIRQEQFNNSFNAVYAQEHNYSLWDTGGYISAKVLTKDAFYLQKSKGYIYLFSEARHRKPRMSQHIHIFVTLSMTVDDEKLSRRGNLKAYIIFIMLLYFQMLQPLLSSVTVHD